jgi:ankyrin repeat protein
MHFRHVTALALAIPCLAQQNGTSDGSRAEFTNPKSEKVPWSLQYAAAHKQTNVVAMLLALGRDVNELGAEGNRALDISCLNGDAATAKLLLDHGANPNLRNQAGSTPLHDAALKGTREVIELLLAHGAEINARDRESGSTPLHFAASFGRLEAVKALVAHGADTESKSVKGSTALQLATENGFSAVVTYLTSVRSPR